jgi:hypothetical protein
MKTILTTLASFSLLLTACGSPSDDYDGYGAEPPRPAPEVGAPGEVGTTEASAPYVPSDDEAQQWAEDTIGPDNADAEMDALEQEILGDDDQ